MLNSGKCVALYSTLWAKKLHCEYFISWLFLWPYMSVGHELDVGQNHVRTTSYIVLSWCQPTKLNHLAGSCFEVYKGIPKAFWLF